MKIILEYDEEERGAATAAINLDLYALFIADVERYLHNIWKWGDYEHDETTHMIDEVWQEWHRLKADLPGSEE